ncbi:lysoplasmalogenase [Sporosarcina sp. Te-1]|uniref:lysoplasmalogenase n=1 Tax=Sporosarcina sp. Te-1 TaxID=2818390 RepID=UPI001A9F38F7|nr:lysoplasmalogenase [Sporosarcina sp. Te-1]QTD40391.1 lysoplasmalogenase [Sporosarcina sp. Te-1]
MRKFFLASITLTGLTYLFFGPDEIVDVKIAMKLLPMALILIYGMATPSLVSTSYKRLILAGLLICMIADGVIYWFMAGLATFFIGHIFYIAAFRQASRKSVPLWAAIPLVAYGLLMAAWIAGPQYSAGQTLLGTAIIAYIAVILLMGWMAIRTRLPFAIIGALLFICSDSFLAIDRFVTALPYRDAWVMVTYYAAQVFIASSIENRFVKYSVNPNNLIR